MRHLTYKVRFLGLVAIAALAGIWPMAAQAATAPSLGAAASFAVLGASTVTCTGASAIMGDVGVWPGSAITGFPPCTLTGTLQAGNGSLDVKVRGTGTWDEYRQARIGTIQLEAGRQQIVMRPAGSIRGAMIDLKDIRLTGASAKR